MQTLEFINVFWKLGQYLLSWLRGEIEDKDLELAMELSSRENEFFTIFMQRTAIENIVRDFLDKEKLNCWIRAYAGQINNCSNNFSVGIIMAGNIPMVGFHDLLCSLAVGTKVLIKPSSKDNYLIPTIINILFKIEPKFKEKIIICKDLKSFYSYNLNALIATGSSRTIEKIKEESSRQPILTRGSRFSFAVLDASENSDQLDALAQDVFLYYGMGCRSVSYLFLPEGYCFTNLLNSFAKWEKEIGVGAFLNIYKRLRAVLKMQGDDIIDGNFFLLRQSTDIWSNRAEIRYRFYSSLNDVLEFQKEFSAQIQKKYTTFGLAQRPSIGEYADDKDTIKFLLEAYKNTAQ